MMSQDLPYCTPASSPCLDSIPVTSGDCRVSCTGLYADVTQEAQEKTDKMFKIILELMKYKHEEKRLLNDYNELKKTEDKEMSKTMARYVAYKKDFVKNMRFDPSTSGLSKCTYSDNPNHHTPQTPP